MRRAYVTAAVTALAIVALVVGPRLGQEAQGDCTGGATGGFGASPLQVPSWRSPLAESLDAFNTERADSDELPLDDCRVEFALDFIGINSESQAEPGEPLPEESRRALTGLAGGREIYVLPTSHGYVCAIVTGPASTHECTTGTSSWTWSYLNPDDGPPYVWGILPNEIVAAYVGPHGATKRAAVDRNVFYYELPGEIELDEVELILRHADGEVTTID